MQGVLRRKSRQKPMSLRLQQTPRLRSTPERIRKCRRLQLGSNRHAAFC